MSKVYVNAVEPEGATTTLTLGASGDTVALGAGALASGFGGGKILQVVSAIKTDTFSHNATSWADITGLSVSITPSATSSKIYVTSSIAMGQKGHTSYQWVQLVRDSTAIFIGDAAGSRHRVSVSAANGNSWSEMSSGNIVHIDEPNTTSATTYKLQLYCQNTDTQYINRSFTDTDNTSHARGASSIIVMEIGV